MTKNIGNKFSHRWRQLSLPYQTGKIATLALVASAGVYLALRIWSIWTPRLWGDELFNYSLSQGTWLTLLKRAGLDMAHPPLFYILLKPWIHLVGSSMSRLRAFTVAISIAAILPLIVLGRELRLRTEVIALALGLMAVNSYLIIYSYYLRPYSLLNFLTLCSLAAFVRFLRHDEADKTRLLIILVIVNVLFTYTHYFAWLTVAAQFLWVALTTRQHLRRITLVMLLTALCSLPWLGVIVYVSTQVPYTFLNQISWDVPPNSQSFVLLLRCFNGGFKSTWLTLVGSSILMLLVIVSLKTSIRGARAARHDDDIDLKPLAILAWLTMFPIIVSLIVSRVFTWKWEPRYVIVSSVPYLLLVAACAFHLRTPRLRAAAITFLLGWAAIAGVMDNIAETLHGPNAPSYQLAQDLSRVETQAAGQIPIYGLSPYAGQGLSLALSITGEQRFKVIACPVDTPLPDNYFWLAVTEHDPLATARVSELASDPAYSLGEPIYSGIPPQRHIAIPVRRR